MPKLYTAKLNQLTKNPQVKKIIDLEYIHECGQCENCGGLGIISIFLANMGPFTEVGAGHLISKWCDGKWWCAPGFVEPGKDANKTNFKFGTVSDTCPVCHGQRRISAGAYVPMPQECRDRLNSVCDKMKMP